MRERVDKRLRAIARDIRDEVEAMMGLDLLTGEMRVKVDMDKVGEMREALRRAAALPEGSTYA